MTDLRKAAEMALKFCEDIGELSGPYPYVNGTAIVSDSRKVSQALRQALAQPEQEAIKQAYIDGLNNGIKAEREACAKVCEKMEWPHGYVCAAAIRARGER